jgi:hypothetical protein
MNLQILLQNAVSQVVEAMFGLLGARSGRRGGASNFIGLQACEPRVLLSDVTWNPIPGNGDGVTWSDNKNWVVSGGTARAPVAGDDVHIPINASITVDTDVTVHNLTLAGAHTITLTTAAATPAYNLHVTNHLALDGDGLVVRLDCLAGGTITVDGSARVAASGHTTLTLAGIAAFSFIGSTPGAALDLRVSTTLTLRSRSDLGAGSVLRAEHAQRINGNILMGGNLIAMGSTLTSTTSPSHFGVLQLPTPLEGMGVQDLTHYVDSNGVIYPSSLSLLGGVFSIPGVMEILEGSAGMSDVTVLAGTELDVTSFTKGKALLSGGGTVVVSGISSPTVTTTGVGADLAGGDGFMVDPQTNMVVVNPEAEDRFGTLTIDGDLDASAGFTLDSVLGSSGYSNKLVVTGNATFGGDLLDQFRAFKYQESAAFSAGDAWTLLTAGTITEGFRVPENDSYGRSSGVEYEWGARDG